LPSSLIDELIPSVPTRDAIQVSRFDPNTNPKHTGGVQANSIARSRCVRNPRDLGWLSAEVYDAIRTLPLTHLYTIRSLALKMRATKHGAIGNSSGTGNGSSCCSQTPAAKSA